MFLCCRMLRAPRPCATSAWLRCAAAWALCAAGEQTAPCASAGPHSSHRRWLTSYCVRWQLKVGKEGSQGHQHEQPRATAAAEW